MPPRKRRRPRRYAESPERQPQEPIEQPPIPNQDGGLGVDMTARVAVALERMTQYLEQQAMQPPPQQELPRANPPPHIPPVVDNQGEDVALERFQKFKPPKFTGEPDSEKAEVWLETMEDIFVALNYSDRRRVAFASFQLQGAARAWWRVITEKWELNQTPRTWDSFVQEFNVKYFPALVREKKEDEFLSLRQGLMTVAEYEARFTKLSKFVPEMVNTDAKRRRRFLQGLKIEIQHALASSNLETYVEAFERAQRVEDTGVKLNNFQTRKNVGPNDGMKARKGDSTSKPISQSEDKQGEVKNVFGSQVARGPQGAFGTQVSCNYCGKTNHREKDCWRKVRKCLKCGSSNHKIWDCPQVAGGTRAPQQLGGQGQRRVGEGASKTTIPARVYAINEKDDSNSTDVV